MMDVGSVLPVVGGGVNDMSVEFKSCVFIYVLNILYCLIYY